MADKMAGDKDPSIRREVALSLRDLPYDKAKRALAQVIDGYDGKNRWYLEAIGAASVGNEDRVYDELVRPSHAKTPHAEWGDPVKNLAWRLHTPQAIEDLHATIQTQKPAVEDFRRWVMGYASYRNDTERKRYRSKLESLAREPGFEDEIYQVTIEEVAQKDLSNLQGEGLTESFIMPTRFGPDSVLSDVKTISAMEGNAANGKIAAARCTICHKIGAGGVSFGPHLTNWGQARGIEEIVKEIMEPNAKLAHGFDKPVRLSKGTNVAEGMLSNFSWHAGSLKIKLFGGDVKKILFRRNGVKVEELKNHSWMPTPSRMGLSDQDVRDIAEYLKKL
jgi:putative heme-binding domain-containing protein